VTCNFQFTFDIIFTDTLYRIDILNYIGDRRDRDRMVDGFTTNYMQAVPITTEVVSSNPAHGEIYSMQHHVIACK
jgi:hypothetical protein